MKTLVFFLEEFSAKVLLETLLPRFFSLDGICVRYQIFEGKQDLEKNLKRRLQGWRLPDSYFVILRDQDAADCKQLKSRLRSLCPESKRSRSLIRIACHELESWYLGDLKAVEQGLGIPNLERYQSKAKFRNPDSIHRPSQELERISKFRYQKVSGSRAIAPYLDPDKNLSKSFQVFVKGIKKIVEEHQT